MVEYDRKEQAAKAIEEMNGGELLQKTISVDWSFKIEKDATI